MVAALLEDDQAPAGRGDPPPDLVVDVGGQGEVADRVEAVGVEPERDDDDRTRHGHDRLERPVDRGQVLLVGRSGPERDVQVLPCPVALAGLVAPPRK